TASPVGTQPGSAIPRRRTGFGSGAATDSAATAMGALVSMVAGRAGGSMGAAATARGAVRGLEGVVLASTAGAGASAAATGAAAGAGAKPENGWPAVSSEKLNTRAKSASRGQRRST